MKLDFGNLEEVEFDRSLATKDGHEDHDFAFGFVDGVDLTQEVGERSVGDFDGFAHREAGFEFGSGLFDEFLDAFDFFFG